MHTLKPDGSVQQVKLGDPIQDPDASPQVIIAVGAWVAAELEDKLSYCLISVVQAPGKIFCHLLLSFVNGIENFDSFKGFDASKAEVGQPEALISRYPQSETLINRLAPPRQLPTTTADAVDDE